MIVSPNATHPADSGGRRGILNIADMLRDLGWIPVLLYTDYLAGDTEEMRAYWGSHYYFQPYRPTSVRWIFKRFLRAKLPEHGKLRSWYRLRLNNRAISHNRSESRIRTLPVDAYYEPSLDAAIDRLHTQYAFQAVIAEYVCMSSALLRFAGQSVRRLIDTHELFALGEASLTAPPSKQWVRITAEEELAALQRADTVLAIQDRDAATLRKAGVRRVETVGHSVAVAANSDPEGGLASGNVLFVSSGHPFDVAGLHWFAREVFPKVASWLKPKQVVVAGGIRDVMTESPPFTFLGRVPDLAPVYRRARLVIAPLHQGTGLKVKAIEALGYCRTLVATSFAARGMEDGIGSAFMVADHPEAFAANLARLMFDDRECRRLMCGARSYAHAWNERQKFGLKSALES